MRWGIKTAGWLLAGVVISVIALGAACGGDDDASGPSSDEALYSSGGTEAITRDGDGFSGDLDGAPSGVVKSDGSAPDAGPPAVAGGEAMGGNGAPLPQLLDRKLIRTATVNIETEEVSQRFEQIGNIAAAAGGIIAGSSFGSTGEHQTASVTIRVPGDRYQEVIAELRQLGEVRNEQSSASDVTEEYTDLQSRVRNLQATEAQYLTLLQRAESINDILIVQDRLNIVRAEIEQVQGRIQLLANQTELATITVHLAPPALQPKPDPKDTTDSPLEAAQEAFEASLDVLKGIATVALSVAAFSWWLVPLAAAGLYFGRRQMRADRERREAPPPAPSL